MKEIDIEIQKGTASLTVQGKTRCAYCLKELDLKTDIEYDERKRKNYFECDCEWSEKEKTIKKEIQEFQNKINFVKQELDAKTNKNMREIKKLIDEVNEMRDLEIKRRLTKYLTNL